MKALIREWGIPASVIGVVLLLMFQVYQVFNLITNDRGPILILQNTLIRSQTEESKQALAESIEFKIQDILNPTKFLYSAIPYYKSKSITLGIYQEELAGYFKIPEDEMITLTENNIYEPELPITKKQEVDTALLDDPKYLMSKIFFAEPELKMDDELLGQWDFRELAERELTIDQSIPGPKVLIFHTHVKEEYKGESKEDTITIGDVGIMLEEILEEEYGLETIQVTDDFYPSIESTDVTGNYERMEPVIQQVLDENPSIQIVIDLHRDGVREGVHLVGDVEGQQAAQVMFVNGLCMSRNANDEIIPMKYLHNPYLEENLAFSVQTQLMGMEYYPEIMRKILLKPYRYSTHMVPYSILIELGAQTNTPEEAMNAVEPIAHMIGKVFQGD